MSAALTLGAGNHSTSWVRKVFLPARSSASTSKPSVIE